MKLVNYINDLLYRYDCVIIPNFGGFVTNTVGAKIDEVTHKFYPPSKQISFNSYLKHNDGLLANYCASSENISFEDANIFISKQVEYWKTSIAITPLSFDGIGVLYLNADKQFCFEPKGTNNFLVSSFGLSFFETTPISSTNDIIEAQVEELIEFDIDRVVDNKESIITKSGNEIRIPRFVNYAASVAILATLGIIGMNNYRDSYNEDVYLLKRMKLQTKIQSATFLIPNVLPTVNLQITKLTDDNYNELKRFHIIAAAFRSEGNAAKKVEQLVDKGFKASVIGKNKWDLFQVAYESYSSKEEAMIALQKIKKFTDKDAWLFAKDN